ncbi:MAG TPA: carboxypeptidase regulatory-like domain-containing protein [Terriglobales bacterium]|nr:carboxypeptidase regulatory-like domain-containing protein [Terriglobales bacterium]
MKIPKILCVLMAVMALSALSAATNLKGTVKNGTTGKPAAGDDVVLLDMSQGMTEAARTKSDAQGHFSVNYEETGGPHMVRVLHQGVNYFPQGGIIPPGTSTAEVTVYDAAAKVQGIGLTVDMLRAQSEGNNLQVTELWVVKNTSSPPRTQMSDNAFELMLPPDAQVDSSMASGPGGQPVNSAPVPQSEKNKYAFVFPLRPGETRFQVSYHLPYSGKIKIGPRPLYATDHVVVMLPKSMQFAGGGAGYQTMEGGDPNANIQVITNVNPGQDLSFNLSGTGTIQEGQQTATASGGGGGMGQRRGGPGGGLGAPEETPDPLHRYRGFILGGLAVALALGVFYVMTRPKPAMASGAFVSQQPAPAVTATKLAEAKRTAVPPQPQSSNRVLDALKEELFQLELERHQGKISAAEYEKAKAALDTTLARAAKRASS